MLKLNIFFCQMQPISKSSKVAQSLNKRHILIVLDSANTMQPSAPDLNLLQKPLVCFRLTSITPDHNLLCQATAVRAEHRV
ncbi:Uncharacterised protein [Shigella sonnei]|nr:Uncharacterised protein [Shigella sonnei]